MKYYPALWYDIGPQTAAARNALFGFRAELFAENFIKRLNDWCAAHHLEFGGHLDQEEPLNPTPLTGDLMKVFKYQTLPTVDDIWWYGRSNVSYKIVTSAAFNYDHPIARAETYAAYRGLTDKIAFQVAMDQFAMGINSQIPARTVQPKRPELNDYVGRLSYLLQHGRHVADVAVLYPIASLHAQYHNVGGVQFPLAEGEQPPQIMETAYAREGGPAFGMDYQDIGEALFRGLRVDYTYLHPEVLVERCIVDGKKLILNNRENREEYRVLILPAGDTLSVAAAAKIKEFYDEGGMVIATGMLPTRSRGIRQGQRSATGHRRRLRRLARRTVEGRCAARAGPPEFLRVLVLRQEEQGRRTGAFSAQHASVADGLRSEAGASARDVDIQEPLGALRAGNEYEGALTYIHKVKDGRDIYFFANSSLKDVDTKVVLRGKKALSIWNPHTGGQEPAEFTQSEANGQPVTMVRLVLPSVSSLFFIGQ